jgi:2-(1,2-epoxy-1,2-dihydrophenyl)acetyl-CoA isomerase
MSYEDLLLEKEEGIATITLSAPQKMNALTVGMRKSLLRVADEIADDDEVRAVIVTGAGRGFCAGADLSGAGAGEPSRRQRLEMLGPSWAAEAFFPLDKPVIAAINGACVGAGFSLALSMDIRIASEAAKFGAVFVLRGLTPDCGITYWLPRMVGMSKAMELMFTGEIIDAAEAERLGLVSKVVPPGELMGSARELASKIVAQPPISVELSKRMVYRARRDDYARQIELETLANRICSGTEDSREAVRAFFEKRAPARFRGW